MFFISITNNIKFVITLVSPHSSEALKPQRNLESSELRNTM